MHMVVHGPPWHTPNGNMRLNVFFSNSWSVLSLTDKDKKALFYLHGYLIDDSCPQGSTPSVDLLSGTALPYIKESMDINGSEWVQRWLISDMCISVLVTRINNIYFVPHFTQSKWVFTWNVQPHDRRSASQWARKDSSCLDGSSCIR